MLIILIPQARESIDKKGKRPTGVTERPDGGGATGGGGDGDEDDETARRGSQ